MKRIILGIFCIMKLAANPQAEATVVSKPSAPMQECSLVEADLDQVAMEIKQELIAWR